jgi:TP901 family phage tail tape measure protein
MSDTINTIVDKQAYEQVSQLAEELKKSRLELVQLLEIAKGGGISFKNIQLPSDLDKQMKKNRQETEQVSAAIKEQERVEKALIAALQKKTIASEGANKALIKARFETQEINKEQKRQAVISSSLTGEYKRQSTILNTLRDKYKDLVLSQKGGTKEARALKNEITQLDSKLKAVDASVGQHQRNVGNYQSALQGLHPVFGQINRGLEGMGTNLNDLSTAKDPFKSLATSIVNFGKATLAFLLSPVGLAITALGALFMLIKGNKDTVLEFDSQLINVGKTTGITGQELQNLGGDIVNLSRRLKTVGTPALLEYATVAGQLGVKGTKNILAFAEGLAKLETASNIAGEEGAASIARLLTLTDGGVQNIKDFGDEIVILGNNFAATEKEILGNATAIAQNTAVYKFGRKDVLAYATATKAVGVEAELTGSTIGRTLGQMEKALRTGKNVQSLAELTGKSVEDLKAQFAEDSAGVFQQFVKGLNEIDKAGGSVNEQLEKIGITSVRDQRVLGSLATAGFDTLTEAIEKTTEATGSLDQEFTAASGKLETQLSRMGIAWDNLVLSLENGQGVFGKFFAFLAGTGAEVLEAFNRNVNFISAGLAGLGNMLSKFLKTGQLSGQAFKDGFEGTLKKINAENILKESMEAAIDYKGGIESVNNELGKAVKREKQHALEIAKKNEVMEYSIGWFDQLISRMKEQQKNTALSTQEFKRFADEIERLEKIRDNIKSIDIVADSDALKGLDKMFNSKLIEKGFKDLSGILETNVEELYAEFASQYKWDYDEFLKFSQKKIAQSDFEAEAKRQKVVEWLDISRVAIMEIGNLFATISQRKIDKLENEIQAQDEMYENILENEEMTAERRKEIEQEREREREKLEQKKREEQRKSAIAAKKFAILEIALNTAAGIVEALPNIPLSIAVGAIGALQLATAIATPIPAYAEGKDASDPYEGPMLWGEAGPEAKIDRSGKLEFANKPTIGKTKKGDQIIPLKAMSYDAIVRASIMANLAHQGEKLSGAETGNAFDQHLLQETIKSALKGVKIVSNVNNNNSALVDELKKQRRRDV